ncbi:succinoglycan biosynthesis protein exoi [Rhizobium hidalgonense]|uniref:Succinoglycan biosynthesis protein exoi n=1 Tax=Rhizobium hidalgonense TaxID=1538159 RepID=A0AAJ2GXD5_9HYPH|nr:succinoglycan biosynthesis protein exoi [Rhizobium hidalgonense]MDR9775014.1 succinoglycan biosynthesis protein exoi [Rhizobium hidalgonense]MDR9823494.1 succinoglycan biosynthesis protein exoi [Rhizobium hidalgonense]
MRRSYRNAQKKSVLFKAPGLLIGALAFGAAGGSTFGDLLASWNGSDGFGQSCNIKGNISIETGERIFYVPGQRYYSQTKINPQYAERWFCSELEAWAAGWRKSKA